MSYLSDMDIDRAARLWDAGSGTLEIAASLKVSEAVVYNHLNYIRIQVDALRDDRRRKGRKPQLVRTA